MQDPLILSLYPVFEEAQSIKIGSRTKLVIFSDLHIGDHTKKDDFLKNSSLFMYVLQNYYFKQGFHLVLNGDIEELHRFTMQEIERGWQKLYELFDCFARSKRLYKTLGNHDIVLPLHEEYPLKKQLYEAIKFYYDDNTLFVFHGHQASGFQTKFNMLGGLLVRYIARPLNIRSYSVSHNKTRQYKVERRVFTFSHDNGLVSILGHTHRPLFESLSKVDFLRFKIEKLCREYTESGKRRKKKITEEINHYKNELKRANQKNHRGYIQRSTYAPQMHIPCLFNSGCGIGKRGITAIEIEDGDIALVYWFDLDRTSKYFNYYDREPEQLDDSSYYRVVLNRDNLNYIFTRIRLLSD